MWERQFSQVEWELWMRIGRIPVNGGLDDSGSGHRPGCWPQGAAGLFLKMSSVGMSRRSRCTEEDDARDGVLSSTHTVTCVVHSNWSIPVLVFAFLFLESPFSHQGKTTSHTLTHPSAPPLTTLPFPFPAAPSSPSGSQATTAPPIGAAPATCTYRENGGSREYTYTCVSSEVDARCVETGLGVKAREVMRAVWCVHLSVRFCVKEEGWDKMRESGKEEDIPRRCGRPRGRSCRRTNSPSRQWSK